MQIKAKNHKIKHGRNQVCGVYKFAAKFESRVKQMDSDSFSVLTGLRKSIDLVFGTIMGVFQKGEGQRVSVFAVEVLS